MEYKTIIRNKGCTSFSTIVDGKDLYEEMTLEEKEVLLEQLIKIQRLNGIDFFIGMLLDHTEGDFESLGHCDQCGDTPYKEIFNLDEFRSDNSSLQEAKV